MYGCLDRDDHNTVRAIMAGRVGRPVPVPNARGGPRLQGLLRAPATDRRTTAGDCFGDRADRQSPAGEGDAGQETLPISPGTA